MSKSKKQISLLDLLQQFKKICDLIFLIKNKVNLYWIWFFIGAISAYMIFNTIRFQEGAEWILYQPTVKEKELK